MLEFSILNETIILLYLSLFSPKEFKFYFKAPNLLFEYAVHRTLNKPNRLTSITI